MLSGTTRTWFLQPKHLCKSQALWWLSVLPALGIGCVVCMWCLLVEMNRSWGLGGWPVIMILQTVSSVLKFLSLHFGVPMTNQMTTPLKSILREASEFIGLTYRAPVRGHSQESGWPQRAMPLKILVSEWMAASCSCRWNPCSVNLRLQSSWGFEAVWN